MLSTFNHELVNCVHTVGPRFWRRLGHKKIDAKIDLSQRFKEALTPDLQID